MKENRKKTDKRKKRLKERNMRDMHEKWKAIL